jgi:hypothetical protein
MPFHPGPDPSSALWQAFDREFSPKRKILVGGDGIPLEELFSRPAERWLR